MCDVCPLLLLFFFASSPFSLRLTFRVVGRVSPFRQQSQARCCSSKHGRRSKFKWPDTFLIESSGRRETPESIAESKAREARRQNVTQSKQSPILTPEEEENIADSDADVEAEHRLTDNDTGSDQDISEDEDFEDSMIDETSESLLIELKATREIQDCSELN